MKKSIGYTYVDVTQIVYSTAIHGYSNPYEYICRLIYLLF